MVASAPPSLPVLNCPFLIFSANSIPLIVTTALSNRLNPSIGRIRCFTRRWSCSIKLFKYWLDRTFTRRGFPIFLHFPHGAVRCRVGVQGDLCGLARLLHRTAEKGLGRVHIPISTEKEIDRPACFVHRPIQIR